MWLQFFLKMLSYGEQHNNALTRDKKRQRRYRRCLFLIKKYPYFFFVAQPAFLAVQHAAFFGAAFFAGVAFFGVAIVFSSVFSCCVCLIL